MNGQDGEPGWPRGGSNYVFDVLKALVVQLCMEVARRWLGLW